MKDFRGSVVKLLVATCFLLLVAWLSMRLMQYNGDWERLFSDLLSQLR